MNEAGDRSHPPEDRDPEDRGPEDRGAVRDERSGRLASGIRVDDEMVPVVTAPALQQ